MKMISIFKKKIKYPTGILGFLTDLFIVSIIAVFFIYLIQQHIVKNRLILNEGSQQYNNYTFQYFKDNPDMTSIIEGYENCYSGKIYKVKGCHNYIGDIASEEQQIKLSSYLYETNKIKMDVQKKLYN